MMNSVNHMRTSIGHGFKPIVMTLVVALSATVGLSAWAQQGSGGHRDHGGMGGAGMFGAAPEHMARMLDRMLDGLSATEAQRAQIKQIAEAAATDMTAQREAGRALREKGIQIFSAPTVDAAAAEQLRQQMLAQHDQLSRRTLQAMLEASKVLTPEQRAKAGERMRQRGDSMHERMQRGERERPKS